MNSGSCNPLNLESDALPVEPPCHPIITTSLCLSMISQTLFLTGKPEINVPINIIIIIIIFVLVNDISDSLPDWKA